MTRVMLLAALLPACAMYDGPQLLVIDPDVSEDMNFAVRVAGSWWNERAGKQLFTEDPEATGVRVVFHGWHTPEACGYLAGKAVLYGNHVWLCDLSLTEYPEAYASAAVVAHELGHILGLQHSEFRDNIMYPYTPLEMNLTKEQLDNVR